MSSRLEQATNYDEWLTYVDPQGIITRDVFDAMSITEKLDMIRDVFGADADADDTDDVADVD